MLQFKFYRSDCLKLNDRIHTFRLFQDSSNYECALYCNPVLSHNCNHKYPEQKTECNRLKQLRIKGIYLKYNLYRIHWKDLQKEGDRKYGVVTKIELNILHTGHVWSNGTKTRAEDSRYVWQGWS